MSMNVGGKKGSMSDINITPYIDILLVLLIIFMVIVPIRQMDLDVKVPQPSNNPQSNAIDPNVIVVSIDESENLKINQEATTKDRLGDRLTEIFKTRNERTMFVQADSKLFFNSIVDVIDIAKGAGVDKIGLITEKIQSGQ